MTCRISVTLIGHLGRMGYYTYHELHVGKANVGKSESAHEFKDYAEDVDYARVLEEVEKQIGFNPFDDDCKWYSSQQDMLEVSKKFPELLIRVHGNGEESDDIWYHYFHNGKQQFCKVEFVFPDMDWKKFEV